jgi:fatty acid synthase
MVGVSFGALLALELANMLEKVNIKGQLISVDGAADFFKHTDCEKFMLDNFEYKTDFILRLLKIIYPDKKFDLSDLLKADDCNSTEKLCKMLQAVTIRQDDKLTEFANGYVNRLKFCTEYDDRHLRKIDLTVTLIRASRLRDIDIDEAYGLNEKTINKVTVTYIDGNHYTMLENKRLSQIINATFVD